MTAVNQMNGSQARPLRSNVSPERKRSVALAKLQFPSPPPLRVPPAPSLSPHISIPQKSGSQLLPAKKKSGSQSGARERESKRGGWGWVGGAEKECFSHILSVLLLQLRFLPDYISLFRAFIQTSSPNYGNYYINCSRQRTTLYASLSLCV